MAKPIKMPIPAGAIQLNKKALSELPAGTDELFYVRLFRLWEPEPKLIFAGMLQLHVQVFVDDRKRFKGMKSVILSPKFEPDWAEYAIDERPGQDDTDVQNTGACITEDYLMEVYRVPAAPPAPDVRQDKLKN